MNALDRAIAWFSPARAVERAHARKVLSQYDAAEPSRLRKFHRDRGSQNEMVQRSATAIRAQARYLARNHDIARGALRTLVNAVVGPKGIGVEPQPRRADGSIHTEYAKALLEAYRDWQRLPEVTHRLTWPALQRAMFRAQVRDGECFGQMIVGLRSDLDHGTRVPFSIEAFEADLVPFDLNDPARNILQGMERNTWGKVTAAHVLKTDVKTLGHPLGSGTKRIPWDRLLHVATLDNLGQLRGISDFASVITRLEDIKDYEESERVAAKIAAMLTAYIKKGSPDMVANNETTATPRQITFQPGMVIDDLAIGEDIGLIDSSRPNPNLVTFRQGQLKAAAAGFGTSYSSMARDYSGTYSAQRQELVEQWMNYAVLCDEFVGQLVQPVWETFVLAAHLSGVVRIPADVLSGSHDDALYVAQSMPWIDPYKEAIGFKALIDANLGSEPEFIRRRGANPDDVIDQRSAFLNKARESGLAITAGGIAEAIAATGEDANE